MTAMTTLARLRLAALREDPAAPLITDCTQGRVELSRVTFDNWVNKTVNFLQTEAELGQAATLVIDLPLHWMAAVWFVAAWEAGVDTALTGEGDLSVGTRDADIVVVADPLGMAPPPAGVSAQWFFPADVRTMPDQRIFAPADPGAMRGMTAEGLCVQATGFAERVGLAPDGRLLTDLPLTEPDGVLAAIAAPIAVRAAAIYGSGAEQERPTATA